jgi:hypothetical protein
MNPKRWQKPNGHPPSGLLLLHLEGEVHGRLADDLRRHIGACGDCRKSCAQLESGHSTFVAYRDGALLPAPAPRPQAFRQRLLALQNQPAPLGLLPRLRDFLALHAPSRLTFTLSAATAGVAFCLFFLLGTPRQSVYASQILENARSASDSLLAHSKVLHQRIRLQRASLVIERDLRHSRQSLQPAHAAALDPRLQQTLALARVNLDDPLSASDFAGWRSGQARHTDSVRENAQSVTITTRVEGAAIEDESLTLSRSDWRPIARRVEVRGEAPIEIDELSYEVADSGAGLIASAPAPAAPLSATAAEIPAPAEISPADLEASEIDLREALHAIGADVSASPDIWRSEHTVFVHPRSGNAHQMEAIAEAVRHIPHVKETARLGEAPQPPSAPNTTQPPLAQALAAEIGGTQEVGAFLASWQSRSAHVLAEAAALDELGRRYPADTTKALSPDLRARVNRLAAAMLSSLQRDSAESIKVISPKLDALAQQMKLSTVGEESEHLPGCLAWQENAALAAPRLRDFDRSVTLLFLPSQSDKSAALSPEKLLSDSLRAKSFLDLHLMSTCQIFSAN